MRAGHIGQVCALPAVVAVPAGVTRPRRGVDPRARPGWQPPIPQPSYGGIATRGIRFK